jgi:hypothetical protein
VPAGTVMHRQSCLAAVGGWPEHLPSGGDLDLWQRIIAAFGPESIGFARDPSHLHFLAEWRLPNDRWPDAMSYVRAMAAVSSHWPPGLRIAQQPGQSLQSTIWATLRSDPITFGARIRWSTAFLQDKLAWQSSQNTDFY